MTQKATRLPRLLLLLATLLMLLLCIAGGVRTFSPVPQGDMWDTYITVIQQLRDNGISALFKLHNEHRLVLPRLFFLIDLELFGGTLKFLIVLNYLLAAIAAATFIVIIKSGLADPGQRSLRGSLACLSVSLCFFWGQKQNLTWGFQNQFFLAQLLPLVGFYLLYLSTLGGPRSTVRFALASLAGIASAGCMANGILALPVMAALAFLLRAERRHTGLLVVLAVTVNVLYFYNFQPFSGGGSRALEQPLAVARLLLQYLGSPAYFMTGSNEAAEFCGAFILLSCLYFAVQALTRRHRDGLLLMLLAFLLYLGGSALGTAAGRIDHGTLASRYTTPALMGWLTLLIVYARHLGTPKTLDTPVWLALLLTLGLLPQQWQALSNQSHHLHQKLVAALAVELQINDPARVETIYLFPDKLLRAAPALSQQHLSILGDPRIRGSLQELGSPAALEWLRAPSCRGQLESVEPLAHDANFLLIRGWMYDSESQSPPPSIRVIDHQGRIVGRALSGMARADVRREWGSKARYSGFTGYLSLQAARGTLLLVADGARPCRIEGLFQDPAFNSRPATLAAQGRFASSAAIEHREGWNDDVAGTVAMPGYRLFSTYRATPEATRDVLVLNLARGESIYYRSSTAGSISILGHEDAYRSKLPIAPEWTILDFDQPSLPARFRVLIDGGQAGPEGWAVVALRGDGGTRPDDERQ
jgi:hypothetical protein